MITAIVPCKGRLEHLKECLPTWLTKGIDILVVDYNCPQKTEKYISSLKNKRVTCYKEPVAPSSWNLSKARNAGWRHADGDILLFLDADTILHEGFIKDALSKIKPYPRTFLTGLTQEPWNGCGCLMIYKEDFESVRGYNELMEGWGFEDIDMYGRLEAAGLEHWFFDPALIENIPHAAETRNEFNGKVDQFETHNANAAICATKKFKSVIHTGMHISFHSSTVPAEVTEYQKRVFEHFGIELTQVESDLPHGEAIDEWVKNNDFTRLHIWDADAIPTTSELPTDSKKLCGIAQQAHHIEGKPIYIGAAYITFTKKMWQKWGEPTFTAGEFHDTAGYLTEAAGGFEKCESLWPTHVEVPKWDLGLGSCFGLGTTYQGGIYHAFELRLDNAQMFIDKCKEVLGEQ